MKASAQRRPTDERRGEILAAALRAFTDRGFAAATIADVRRLSGASIGSIYHHFGSKEELAGALYADGLRDYQEGFLAALREHDDAEAGIRAVIHHHLRWVAANRELASFILGRREPEVLLTSQKAVREMNRRLFADASAWLRPHVRAGRLRDVPSDLFYTLLIGPSQEFCRHWLAGRTKTSLKRAAGVLADAAWESLKGDAA